MNPPALRSQAFDEIRDPDYTHVALAVLPAHATADPAAWARRLFSVKAMPLWVLVALGVRQLLVPLLGIPRAPRNIFEVRDVQGDEALLGYNDRHLDFRVGVGVDESTNLVRVVTTVRLKGWRGRVYFVPVRLAHPLVMRSMLKRARRALSGVTA
jgi:hypothetical protein